MKRKCWVSLVCGGLLLIALATPAAAADGGDAPRFALLERVLSWIESWAPTGAPGAGLERETLAGKEEGVPAEPLGTVDGFCDACNNNGEMTGYADPDG